MKLKIALFGRFRDSVADAYIPENRIAPDGEDRSSGGTDRPILGMPQKLGDLKIDVDILRQKEIDSAENSVGCQRTALWSNLNLAQIHPQASEDGVEFTAAQLLGLNPAFGIAENGIQLDSVRIGIGISGEIETAITLF